MTRFSPSQAVILAAIVFGLFHYVIWVSGQPLDVTTMQVIGAIWGGLLFGAFVIWTGSLWPSILMHGLWDSSISISQTLQAETSASGKSAEVNLDLAAALANPELYYGALLLIIWAIKNHRKKKKVINK